MPDGRDVFIHATKYMAEALLTLTKKNGISMNDLDYVIPHQANIRIIDNIIHQLKYPKEKVLNNIQKYGNTGSASAVLVMLENKNRFKKGDLIALTVFGGGYSSGWALIRM
jgi:3-oxoacyl-[acyl-carrier-protein] synthase-3